MLLRSAASACTGPRGAVLLGYPAARQLGVECPLTDCANAVCPKHHAERRPRTGRRACRWHTSPGEWTKGQRIAVSM